LEKNKAYVIPLYPADIFPKWADRTPPAGSSFIILQSQDFHLRALGIRPYPGLFQKNLRAPVLPKTPIQRQNLYGITFLV
jgi:hypothetical protein